LHYGARPDGVEYDPIWLYSHWGGADLAVVLQSALVRGRPRWDDPSYLARIIFSEMIRDEILEETGYGISPFQTNNEYPVLHMDLKANTVRCGGHTASFSEYCDLTNPITFIQGLDNED